MSDVVPIYKPEGVTPLELINQFKKEFPQYSQEKISVAGRLDPMASGLLLFLIGDANKKRSYFQSLDKTYVFTLLIGITTDTYDILGKITSITKSPGNYSPEEVITYLTNFKGAFSQPYPPYSSMHIKGKPLFYWAREGKLADISIPSKIVTIKSLDLQSSHELTKEKLVDDIKYRIKKVKGNFRQNEISSNWENSRSCLPQKLQLFSLKAAVSSGTYIRSLCFELGQIIGEGGIAYTIERTSCGNYNLKDALRLTLQ
jgi:tRNA pseudouridine55 synthase